MSSCCTDIHPTAIVEKGAQLGQGVIVGAYAYIGEETVIGDRCVIQHHATVSGRTQLGEQNEIFPYALIGGKTQDLKYKGGSPGLQIGANNVFREYTTVHLATGEDEYTVMGENNVILAYSHVAHNCQIGNHFIMSSHSALGGHVVVGNYVNVGGEVGVHQFCRLGAHAMVAACAKVVRDVPPFMIVDGNPAQVRGFNKVGLERRGFTRDEIEQVRSVYRIVYHEGLNRTQALEELRKRLGGDSPFVALMLEFAKESQRGFA